MKFGVQLFGPLRGMQGDVLSLVKCSSLEKRKFIDEVAGTADLDRKIETATGELEIVENRVKDSMLVMAGLDETLEKLKEEREVALKYQEIKAQKSELEGRITTVKYFDFKKILEMAHENILRCQKEKKKQEAATPPSPGKSNKKPRLSFKEKQEMQQLESEMEQLNAEKTAIETTLSSGTLSPGELLDKSNRIAEIVSALDEKEMRWLELSEIES